MFLEQIRERAELLQKARFFFQERGVIEVDCHMLQPTPAIDANIDVIEGEALSGVTGYLHTSPEYQMKWLLSQGCGEIFYLGHVFRKGDFGERHQPEFSMAEWYRIGISLDEMIEETLTFLFLFLPQRTIQRLSYKEAFLLYAKIDPLQISLAELQAKVLSLGGGEWDVPTSLQFLFSHSVEPHLGRDCVTILSDFPPWEGALARVIDGVALRFEIFWNGIELANGYHELRDGLEMRTRFEKENRRRREENKAPYPLPEELLSSMASFPDCCGVSVGFDRLLLLRSGKRSLTEVIATSVRWGHSVPCQMP
ncbi:MAG: EF-P lysine aminoacylase GenX [Verrucomicrobiota bacterium]|nr:EF-P lysine aminoacylase GenX [Verrucomicrobiota bacterium]